MPKWFFVPAASSILWTPLQLDGLKLWFDAQDTGTFTKDGSNYVSQWNDKSGNNNHAYQETASLQPLLTANPAVYFNTDQLMLTSPVTVTNFTCLMVIDNVYVMNGNQWLLGSTTAVGLSHGGVTGNFRGYDGVGDISATGDAAEKALCGWSNAKLWQNGVEPDYSATSPLSGFTFDRLGASGSGVGNTSRCGIAELVLYDSVLSDTNRQKLEGYLAYKWGLTDKLPVDHPYKSIPPRV